MIGSQKFKKIRFWIYRNARPLDLARWQYHFEQGDPQAVLDALAAYQNEDGGFGNGLEADCWNPNSSPLQTWWATQFLKEIALDDSDHPIVKGILTYLGSGVGTRQDGHWMFAVPSNNDWPRAPWWTYSEDDTQPDYNPSAALAGYILTMESQDSDLRHKAQSIVEKALETILSVNNPSEMHELACFVELYNDLVSKALFQNDNQEMIKKRLKEMVNATIERDASKWSSEYCCKPSHFFIVPDSILYEDNKDLIDQELALLCESLSEEGTWPVPWAWGSYEEEFAVSRRWWQANIIIQNMRLLKAYDKVDFSPEP